MQENGPAWRDPLVMLDKQRNVVSDSLRDLLAGHSAFLVCGGPSANELPLEHLNTRGIWSLAVNNAAAHPRFRPNAFICADPPSKFSSSIWLDPGIMKIIPTPKLDRKRGKLRRRVGEQFVALERTTMDCPNVWAFQRDSWLSPDDTFFQFPGACWGNHDIGVQKTNQPKTVCTMLLAIRIMYFLGARRIYLVGVDFRMTPELGYSFNQARDEGACSSNNRQFVVVNQWLCEMQKKDVFGRFGLQIFNCNPTSGLRAFPFAPFEDAITEARGVVETAPDCRQYYDPSPK